MVNSDVSEGISDITWSVYGKITRITKTGGAVINYSYDAMGNRISKTYKSASDASPKTTWYVRDASGNVMSVYEKEQGRSGGDLVQSEVHVYGSGRLGICEPEQVVEGMQLETGYHSFTRGKKLYELSNHLGNVLATISDKKVQHDNGSGQVDYYSADVVTANDYYPFGMQMPGRTYTSANSSYRYSFNGKEDDKEISGQQDYGLRIYDKRLGRFKSVDPLKREFAWNSPYAFAENKVIHCIDIDGGESQEVITRYWQNSGGTVLSNTTTVSLHNEYHLGNGILRTTIFEKMHNPNGLPIDISSMTRYQYEPVQPAPKPKNNFSIFPSGCSNPVSENGESMQEFGFVLYGNENGSTLEIGGANAKFKEGLDLGALLASVSDGRPSITDFIKSGSIKKFLEAAEKITESAERFEAAYNLETSSNSKNSSSNLEPVIITDKPAPNVGWTYYERNKDGSIKHSSRQSGLSDSIVPGKEGAPDTIYKRPMNTPSSPQKDIKRKQ